MIAQYRVGLEVRGNTDSMDTTINTAQGLERRIQQEVGIISHNLGGGMGSIEIGWYVLTLEEAEALCLLLPGLVGSWGFEVVGVEATLTSQLGMPAAASA